MTAASDLPEKIGPYRIEGRLGEGGMGEVLRGWDERLQRPVAIKRVRHGDGSPRRRERFRREARAAARLSHPAIVQVHDLVVGESCEPPEPYDALVMELVEGRTLAELGVAGLSVPAVLDLARQIAEGLAEAHGKGLVHRDLKAENVMVSPGGPQPWGRARILDFGLAKTLRSAAGAVADESSLTVEGALLGTSRAMAPEQAEGLEVDARADLFSLGVLLYELLSGRSPFRGASAVQTLKKVLTEEPCRLDTVRPELPTGIADLVSHLLAKNPEARPSGAAEVTTRLEALATLPQIRDLGSPSPGTDPWRDVGDPGLSEAPTADRPSATPGLSPGRLPAPVPALPVDEEASSGTGLRVRRSLLALAALVGVALAVVAWWLLSSPVQPRSVAVLEPELTSQPASSPETEGAQTAVLPAVLLAVLDGLAALEGLDPLDPSLLRASGTDPGDPRAVARALAADEVLQTSVDCREGGWCRVAFRRLAGDSGKVVAATHPFEVSAQPEDSLELAGAVRAHLQRDLFPGHPPREGGALDVRPEDYATFLGLRRRADAGEPLGESGLADLASLLQTSPRFADAYLWAADQARALEHTDQALAWLDRAAALLPGDPRPWARREQTLLLAGRLEDAEDALQRLEELAPGSIRAAAARARWLEAQDRPKEAVAAWERVVERRPSWRNLGRLAAAEQHAGMPDRARAHLEELLVRSPDNDWGLERLAFLEGRSGDLERAEALYRRLTETAPLHRHWSNLAWMQYLLGRYSEARRSGLRALELKPGDIPTRLNLALAEAATGDEDAPLRRCRALLGDLDTGSGDPAGALPPGLRMIRALCLAWTGDGPRALRDVESTLQQEPGDPQIRFQAAAVFTLLGDRRSALYQAERALEAGLRREWLAVPIFADLRQTSAFEALLEGS